MLWHITTAKYVHYFNIDGHNLSNIKENSLLSTTEATVHIYKFQIMYWKDLIVL